MPASVNIFTPQTVPGSTPLTMASAYTGVTAAVWDFNIDPESAANHVVQEMLLQEITIHKSCYIETPFYFFMIKQSGGVRICINNITQIKTFFHRVFTLSILCFDCV